MGDQLKPLTQGLGGLFQDLERRAQAAADLTTRVRAALDGDEKDHVLSASYRESTLVVIADSAAWASHIRYAQTLLLERLREQGETQVTKLRVRVGRPSRA